MLDEDEALQRLADAWLRASAAPEWSARFRRIDELVNSPPEGSLPARVHQLLMHLRFTVPFYRRRLESAVCSTGDPIQALRALPVISSATLRSRFADFVSAGTNATGIEVNASSATTGPTTYHIQSLDDEFVFSAAIRGRIERRHGINAVSSMLDLSPRRSDDRDIFYEPVIGVEYTNGPRFVWKLQRYDEKVPASVAEYDRFGSNPFQVVYGAPSRISDYLRWCESAGHEPKPDLVICTFEELTSCASRRFSEAMGCTVVNLYGSVETGFVASSREGVAPLVVEEDLCFVEILQRHSDEPALPGEVGRVVVTSLKSWIMPVVRYDTGDMAVLASESDLGHGFAHTLGRLDGRSGISFVTQGGVRVGAGRVLSALKDLVAWPFQIVQRTEGELVLVLPDHSPSVNPAEVKRMVESENKRIFPKLFTLSVELGEFRYSQAGKHLPAVQQISPIN